MQADLSSTTAVRGAAAWTEADSRPNRLSLRNCVVAAGIIWAALFILIGLKYQLQLFADGAMFSYSVAAQDVWAFHWHNISGRLPARLVVDPAATYFWLSCQTARANETAERALPEESRRLIRVHACLHR